MTDEAFWRGILITAFLVAGSTIIGLWKDRNRPKPPEIAITPIEEADKPDEGP